VKLKLQHPPGQPPQAFELLKLASSNPFSRGKKAVQMPYQLVLTEDKFRLQSNTVHASQREICGNDTFKLLLKTLLKELFANKGEILSCKSVKPCKNGKKLMGDLHKNKR